MFFFFLNLWYNPDEGELELGGTKVLQLLRLLINKVAALELGVVVAAVAKGCTCRNRRDGSI